MFAQNQNVCYLQAPLFENRNHKSKPLLGDPFWSTENNSLLVNLPVIKKFNPKIFGGVRIPGWKNFRLLGTLKVLLPSPILIVVTLFRI